jgi:hypothetical protein
LMMLMSLLNLLVGWVRLAGEWRIISLRFTMGTRLTSTKQ